MAELDQGDDGFLRVILQNLDSLSSGDGGFIPVAQAIDYGQQNTIVERSHHVQIAGDRLARRWS
jgi:hypothetical protein